MESSIPFLRNVFVKSGVLIALHKTIKQLRKKNVLCVRARR